MTKRAGVAVVLIDNPPANASSATVRQGLLDVVARLGADRDVRAAVLIGARSSFVAGSDIGEFDGPIPAPLLPAVHAALATCPVPVVAALDGFALGGGLELALACDARIATARCRLGLPEVTLGIVPGAGGTQRLPRLVGPAAALDLIVTGRRIDGEEAHALGLVERLASPERLLEDAVELATTLDGRRAVDDLPPPTLPPDWSQVRDRHLARARHRPAPTAAADLVEAAATVPITEMLARERVVFDRLRASAEAAALRHLFFAERAAARRPERGTARQVRRAGVIGAGTMGAGIAALLAGHGIVTTLVDSNPEALARAAAACPDVRLAADVSQLADADLVVEAVVEDLAVKQGLLTELGAVLGPDAVVASNTSYLDLDVLAGAFPDPAAVVGLHFFNPPARMPLLEIVRGASTSDDVLATAVAIARRLGKKAVLARVGEGFIGNRMFAAYRRHCEYLLQDGGTPYGIDTALTGFGFAMGPFAVADLSGLDIAWAMRRRRAATRPATERYVDIPDLLCEAGRLGRKTGAGYYDYATEGAHADDPRTMALLEQSAADAGVTRRVLDPHDVALSAVCAFVNEGARLLAEGVAACAGDLDVVATAGYGFPRHTGGPCWWLAHQDAAVRRHGLALLRAAAGPGFVAGPVDDLLTQVREGR
jgi:3-hydroxyacyl-CoA dehydrogenase